MTTRRLIMALVLGGAVAGLLDLGAAAVINQAGLDVIMRAVARGVLGKAAMSGGAAAAALGLALQLAMGILIALIYGLASLRLGVLVRRPVLFGLLYGLGIFVVMNYVVVPLSAVGKPPHFKTLAFACEHLAAMLGFGLLVAGSARIGSAPRTG